MIVGITPKNANCKCCDDDGDEDVSDDDGSDDDCDDGEKVQECKFPAANWPPDALFPPLELPPPVFLIIMMIILITISL